MMDLKTLAAELHNSKLEHPKYEDVETQYCLWVAGSKKGGEKGQCTTSAATCGSGDSVSQGTLAAEIATARKKNSRRFKRAAFGSNVFYLWRRLCCYETRRCSRKGK